MNKDTLKGDWNIVKGKIKEKWGKLTEDDLTQINGKRDQLVGVIQKKYGLAKEKVFQELAEWEKQCDRECHAGHSAQSGYSKEQSGQFKGQQSGQKGEHAGHAKHGHKH